MAVKPDTDTLIAWLKLQSTPSAESLAVYDEVMATAIDNIESRVDLPTGTDDTHYPQRLRMAILLEAARLAKRSSTPEGAAGMEGVVIRIMGTDTDLERYISRYLKLDGFA